MKFSLPGKWITSGLVLTLLLMGLVIIASLKNTVEIQLSANRVQQTYQTLNTLTNFSAAMTVAESARRGYIFLGSREDLERYQDAIATLAFELGKLEKQIHPSINQKNKYIRLNSLVNQRLAILQESIELHKKDQTALKEQINMTNRSVAIRKEIVFLVAEITNEEKIYLQSSLDASKYNIYLRIVIEIIGTLLSVIVIICLCFILEHQWVNREHLKSLESTLAQEKKLGELKLQLFSMISHEFRTPLSVILLSSQLLREILAELVDEKQLKNLYRIQSSAKLMNHLLTDILTLTRAEAGKLEFKPQLINLENFCLNLVEDLQLFGTSTHTINFINNGQCFRANLDEKLMYCALSNLLLNGIKYSSAGSNVYLILDADMEHIIFQVQDQGIGIPPSEQTNIYEPFYRCQNVDNIMGTGLGLPVVKKCVDIHQGKIYLESELRVGTKFTIYIPLNIIVS